MALKWLFNDSLNIGEDSVTHEVLFMSNGVVYNQMYRKVTTGPINDAEQSNDMYKGILAYRNTEESPAVYQEVFVHDEYQEPTAIYWNDDAYKTVEFAEEPTGDFLTWLSANANPITLISKIRDSSGIEHELNAASLGGYTGDQFLLNIQNTNPMNAMSVVSVGEDTAKAVGLLNNSDNSAIFVGAQDSNLGEYSETSIQPSGLQVLSDTGDTKQLNIECNKISSEINDYSSSIVLSGDNSSTGNKVSVYAEDGLFVNDSQVNPVSANDSSIYYSDLTTIKVGDINYKIDAAKLGTHTYSDISTSISNVATQVTNLADVVDDLDAAKQNKLIAGTGIAIDSSTDTISCTLTPMQFKGTVGTDGTITWAQWPPQNPTNGDVYKVITDAPTGGSYPVCRAGDVLVYNSNTWVVIPSGDEPSGTVTNVATGACLTGGPITTTGTIAHATSGATAGTYNSVTVDAYGHVTAGSNNSYVINGENDSIHVVAPGPVTLESQGAIGAGLIGSNGSIYISSDIEGSVSNGDAKILATKQGEQAGQSTVSSVNVYGNSISGTGVEIKSGDADFNNGTSLKINSNQATINNTQNGTETPVISINGTSAYYGDSSTAGNEIARLSDLSQPLDMSGICVPEDGTSTTYYYDESEEYAEIIDVLATHDFTKPLTLRNLNIKPVFDDSKLDYTTSSCKAYCYVGGDATYNQTVRIYNYRNFDITITAMSGFRVNTGIIGQTISANSEQSFDAVISSAPAYAGYTTGSITYTYNDGTTTQTATMSCGYYYGYKYTLSTLVSEAQSGLNSNYIVEFIAPISTGKQLHLKAYVYNSAQKRFEIYIESDSEVDIVKINMGGFTFKHNSRSSSSQLGSKIATRLSEAPIDGDKQVMIYNFRVLDTANQFTNNCILNCCQETIVDDVVVERTFEGTLSFNGQPFVIYITIADAEMTGEYQISSYGARAVGSSQVNFRGVTVKSTSSSSTNAALINDLAAAYKNCGDIGDELVGIAPVGVYGFKLDNPLSSRSHYALVSRDNSPSSIRTYTYSDITSNFSGNILGVNRKFTVCTTAVHNNGNLTFSYVGVTSYESRKYKWQCTNPPTGKPVYIYTGFSYDRITPGTTPVVSRDLINDQAGSDVIGKVATKSQSGGVNYITVAFTNLAEARFQHTEIGNYVKNDTTNANLNIGSNIETENFLDKQLLIKNPTNDISSSDGGVEVKLSTTDFTGTGIATLTAKPGDLIIFGDQHGIYDSQSKFYTYGTGSFLSTTATGEGVNASSEITFCPFEDDGEGSGYYPASKIQITASDGLYLNGNRMAAVQGLTSQPASGTTLRGLVLDGVTYKLGGSSGNAVINGDNDTLNFGQSYLDSEMGEERTTRITSSDAQNIDLYVQSSSYGQLDYETRLSLHNGFTLSQGSYDYTPGEEVYNALVINPYRYEAVYQTKTASTSCFTYAYLPKMMKRSGAPTTIQYLSESYYPTYQIGDFYINSSDNNAYMCVNRTYEQEEEGGSEYWLYTWKRITWDTDEFTFTMSGGSTVTKNVAVE